MKPVKCENCKHFVREVEEVYGMHVREGAERCVDNYLKSINSL